MKTSISEKAKVGVMICGHKEYWPQFKGLKERLMDQAMKFVGWVKDTGVEVVGAPFVDTVEDSYAAGVEFRKQDIDLLFVWQTSYVASGRYAQGVLAAGCPFVIVGAQTNLDYSGKMTIDIFETIASGGLTPLAEAWNAFERCGAKPAGMIFGPLEYNDYMAKEVEGWCKAANGIRAFKGAIFGYMGHTYEGMLDMNLDPTMVTKEFGAHVRFVEMCELVDYIENCTEEEYNAKIDQINSTFERMGKSYDVTTKDTDNSDIEWAAKVSVGIDKIVHNNNMSGFAYYYLGENNSIYERTASNMCIGNTLMTTSGIAMAGEADMKTALAMYLTSAFGGGGSFAEFNALDYNLDILLVGHDGPHDIRISDRKPKIRGLGVRHGKRGTEVSVEFSIKHGPITLVAVTQTTDGRYKLVYAEGESLEGWTPQNGNTSTRSYFGKDVCKFVRNWSTAGPSHHASLTIGHVGDVVEKFGKLKGMEVVKVTVDEVKTVVEAQK